MKLKFPHYFELSGLIIVLLATTFQLTAARQVDNISNDSAFLRIEEKIDIIWFEMVDKSESYTALSNRMESFDDWTGTGNFVDKQKEWFDWAYAITMIIGSGLLVAGRWFEIKSS